MDFPDELAHARNEDGSRKFDAGNLAIHLLDTTFVDRVIAQSFDLPYRRAEKKVAYIDDEGNRMDPVEPNAVKLETFVFDALPMAKSSIILETLREQEFAPVKNADGVDSAESSRQLLMERAADWLASAGATVPKKVDGKLSGN